MMSTTMVEKCDILYSKFQTVDPRIEKFHTTALPGTNDVNVQRKKTTEHYTKVFYSLRVNKLKS